MKSKPTVMEGITKSIFGVFLNLVFDSNLTLLIGSSGTGRSFVFRMLDELRAEDSRIVTFNYKDLSRFSINMLKDLIGKFIVIDNADILLGVPEREYIALDEDNQYLLIGRDPSDLMITLENFKRVAFDEGTRTVSFSSLPLL